MLQPGKELGKNGRDKAVSCYSWDKIAKQYEECLNEVVEKRRKRKTKIANRVKLMNQEEAKIVFELLKNQHNKKILNVCSSEENYYKNIKPHIWNILMNPLIKKKNSEFLRP